MTESVTGSGPCSLPSAYSAAQPGPDSNHPGVVLAVFADGHTTLILDQIDFSIWASLNTRQGDETIAGGL